jgi:MoxR-like ATPase
MLGQWIPRKDGGGYQWMDGILTAAVRHGKVCLLDEVNSLKPEVAFAIHGLLDHRRELVLSEKPDENGNPEVVVAHENFGLIAAGNPFYEGVRMMNEAFRDRFAVQLNLGYIKELDVAVIDRHPMTEALSHENQIAVKHFVQKVRDACKAGAIHSDVSTRAFLDFVQNISVHTFQSSRVMFLARFDDEAEQNAVRTCFNEVWTTEGKVQKVVADDAAKTKPKPGRAGKFGAGATSAGTADLAGKTF